MEKPVESAHDGAVEEEGEVEEISIDITEENEVWVHSGDWELFLTSEEARLLGQALIEAADDVDEPTE